MYGTCEVFVDTIPVCSATAFVILVTDTSSSGLTGSAMAPVGRSGHGF
jgi:Na+/alanine symporter